MIGNTVDQSEKKGEIELTYLDSHKPVTVNFNLVATREPFDKKLEPPNEWLQEFVALTNKRNITTFLHVGYYDWSKVIHIAVGKKVAEIPTAGKLGEPLKGTFIRFTGAEIRVEQSLEEIEDALAKGITSLHNEQYVEKIKADKARQWEPLRQEVMEAGRALIEQTAPPKKWFSAFRK